MDNICWMWHLYLKVHPPIQRDIMVDAKRFLAFLLPESESIGGSLAKPKSKPEMIILPLIASHNSEYIVQAGILVTFLTCWFLFGSLFMFQGPYFQCLG